MVSVYINSDQTFRGTVAHFDQFVEILVTTCIVFTRWNREQQASKPTIYTQHHYH